MENQPLTSLSQNRPAAEKEKSFNQEVIKSFFKNDHFSMIKLFWGIALLFSACNLKAQNELKEKEVVGYCAKVYGYDITTKNFMKTWLRKFDPQYESFENNEFELNRRMNDASQEIKNLVNDLKFTGIYTQAIEAEFGKYDFTTDEFEFKPLVSGSQRKQINYNSTFYDDLNIKGANQSTTSIYILNFKDFDGLYMETGDASEFVNKRTTQTYNSSFVNRKVYLKIYYSILNQKLQEGNKNRLADNGLYGYAYKLEIWNDRCMNEDLIGVVTAKTLPPKEIDPVKANFEKYYRSSKVGLPDYVMHPESDNFKRLMAWTQYDSSCKREEVELHGKLLKTSAETKILVIKLFTNCNYNIQPGFDFTFYDKEMDKNYPLVIYETSQEKDGALIKIKINRTTLNGILSSNSTGFRLQINGVPKSVLSGAGISFDKGIDFKNDELDFALGEKEKQVLFSVLRH